MAHPLDVAHLLVWPLAACVCIALLHAYAGLHVLRRGIIFVDLALAQMAALGAVVGTLVEHDQHEAPPPAVARHAAPASAPNGPAAPADELEALLQDRTAAIPPPPAEDTHERETKWLWPILFSLGGAILLSFCRVRGERVPHEAIIGIVYVVAAAVTVLVLSKSPHAHEQMEEMLTGRLLFVDRQGVTTMAQLYAVLGILHWLLRKPFMAISDAGDGNASLGVRLWDCVFYAMFAVMVTQSVAIGGVLVVFSYLIIPGACAALFVAGWRARLILAWLVAIVVSLVGLAVSALADLPSGSTLVASFGVALVLSGGVAPLLRRRRAGSAPPASAS